MTLAVFHSEMSLLNCRANLNVPLMLVTLKVFHFDRSELNDVQLENAVELKDADREGVRSFVFLSELN